MENHPYEGPKIEDYGDLLSMTEAGELEGFEDAGMKVLDPERLEGAVP